MRDRKISCLVVCRGDAPMGILTERDIVRTRTRLGRDLQDYEARDLMSANVVTISDTSDILAAYTLMRAKNIRHLVLTDDSGRVVGVTTLSDILRRLGAEYLDEIRRVDEVMSADLVTVPPETPLSKVMALMAEKDVSCVVAMDGDVPAGIFSERDLVRIICENGDPENRELAMADVMSSPVHTIPGRAYAFEAVPVMQELEVRRLAVVDDQGAVIGLVTQTDIAEALVRRYVGLEEKVRERTSELARNTEELRLANQRLRGLDEMKSAFLSSVSHELRTPLTSLLGFARLVQRDFNTSFSKLAKREAALDAKAKRIQDNLGILVSEGHRMKRLINDFLDLTKIEAGKVEWRDRPASMADFIHHAAQAVSCQFATKPGLELVTEVPDNLPDVRVDMDRMLQVLVNLLNNAAKFTREGKVTVSAAAVAGEMLEVRVQDTGSGIDPEEHHLIFDKFHQMSKHQGSQVEGTGLGLPICKEIIEHYQGRIWVESEPGQGARFIFRIPHMRLKRPTGQYSGTSMVTPGGSQAPLVLAVDDNQGVREYLRQLLEESGFRVATAPDGQSSIEMALELQPDLITMDLMMPGMDGGTAIRRIRENPVTCGIPVVVLSAYPGREVAGGDASLKKPVDENQLIQTIKGLLMGGRITGKKCILVPNPKQHGNLMMISSGRINYIKPGELWEQFSDKFEGTVYVPGGRPDEKELKHLAGIDDVVVVIVPKSGAA